MTSTEETLVQAPSDSAPLGFEAWLSGATGAQRTVEVLHDGALLAEWDLWVAAFKRAQGEEDQPQDPDTQYVNPGASVTAALEQRGKVLLERIRNARTSWWVTGLRQETIDQINDDLPFPEAPFPALAPRPTPPSQASPQALQTFVAEADLWDQLEADHNNKYAKQIEEHERAKRKVVYARGARIIASAFTKATDATGTVLFDTVTPEGITKLYETLGDAFFVPLYSMITQISTTAQAIPGESDFLSILSGHDQTSDDE